MKNVVSLQDITILSLVTWAWTTLFFGVPKEIRTDGGSQFSSQLSSDLSSLLGYHHLVIPTRKRFGQETK